MLNKLLISFLFIITFQICVVAQEKKAEVSSPETPKEKAVERKLETQLYSVAQFWHETKLFVKQPTKWVNKDWLRFTAVVTTTVAVMPFDEAVTNSTQGNQQYYTSAVVEGGRMYGEWYSIIGIAGGFSLYGWIAKDTAAKKVSIELLQAGLYAELITSVLKTVIGRARPAYTDNAFTYKPFTLLDYNFQSMPSGHTTSAFALSTILSRHAHTTFLKILAYVPAGLTMFSRLYQHQHWLSDEVIGAAIGYFVGNWVVDLHEGKRHRINVIAASPTSISFSLDKKQHPLKVIN